MLNTCGPRIVFSEEAEVCSDFRGAAWAPPFDVWEEVCWK